MGTSSGNSLQTISTYSAARSIWVVPPPLNQTPRKISTDSSFTLTITGELGSPSGPGEGKGPKRLPPANSSPLGSSSPGARGGSGPGGPERGPSLLTSPGPLLLSLGASAQPPLARGRAEGPRAGERNRRGLSGPRPRSRSAGRRARIVDAPTRAPRQGGRAGSRALEAGSGGSSGPPTSARRGGPRPLPAHPGGRGPGGRARAGAAPSPPPSPGGGA